MTGFDLIIRGGTVFDGQGRPGRLADVGVRGDRLAAVDDLGAADATVVLEAEGQVVAPGFIDIHSHADETILLYPGADNFIRQGVTTVVGGNCGFSPAPLGERWLLSFWEFDWWDELVPGKYDRAGSADLETIRRLAAERNGLAIDWRTFGEFLDRVERAHPGVNYVPLVGHNPLRVTAMGADHDRPCTPGELRQMQDLLAEALAAGAHGLSTGLDYEPGAHAEPSELLALLQTVAGAGALHATHWRRTGIRKGTGARALVRGLHEAVEMAARTGGRLQISHLMPAYQVYPAPPQEVWRAVTAATLGVIDEARDHGVDLAFDVIPNTDGGVITAPYLVSLLTPWLRDAGSPEQLARNLRAADLRREIRDYIAAGRWYALNPLLDPDWACRVELPETGRNLAETAAAGDPLETMFDLITASPRARLRYAPALSEVAVQLLYEHPLAMVGQDTFALDTGWQVHTPPYYLPHPNTYGGVARFLRVYGRELGPAGAVARLTGRPAAVLGLADRGRIIPGAAADVVVFSPDEVTERGDHLEPRVYPAGITHVVVNGRPVVTGGEPNGVRAGRVLRRS
ncbi:MAG: amidohydrolase family protein [bacterium]|nr:amidohydrolase family protein [bacterium]